MWFVEETVGLPDEIRDAVAADVLGSRSDGAPRSHAQFRRRLRQLVAANQPARAEQEERVSALANRDAFGEFERDGTGTFTVRGSAERGCAATRRVDAIARRLRARGDVRTLAQLRSDVALDLLLYGWFDLDRSHPAPSRPRSKAIGSCSEPFTRVSGCSYSPDGVVDCACAGDWAQRLESYRHVGEPPPAAVEVIVSLTTLLGVDDGIAEIPGHGFVSAARQMALAAGSMWARLVTDPTTGQAVEASTYRYRPGADTARQVRARDRTCRGPGCTVSAALCDLDHEQPWASEERGQPTGGPTTQKTCSPSTDAITTSRPGVTGPALRALGRC